MLDFVIVGGAQAGLSIAYYLNQLGKSYTILDKEEEVGASWLNRWDSLKLFTPSEFNNLPGMAFPAKKGYYPTKENVAEYFKNYVADFNIEVRLNTLVEKVAKEDNHFILKHKNGEIKSRNVVIATGPFHIPYTPSFSKKISKKVFQIHSNYYKNPSQLQEGPAMVVGAGDSGFQILDEVSQTNRTTYFSGATDVRVLPQEILGKTLWWWFTKIGFLSFSRKTWLGKKLSKSKQPIIGTDVKGILKRDNVIPVGKTKNAKDEIIVTENRKIEELKNIVWATGYRPNFSWIEGLELTKDGYPKHHRGISNIEGLYFIGLPWLHTRGSATLGGIKKDAQYLANYIEAEEKTLA
ncbi:putative flavoprotein involved in K+ transport [Salegentibacter holothuriorum]|uniref:Putative flavoprotein involved in K+ transport n=1 Tax=Salegentibacter holothuriorum TaxID=241145 RepID=A0A1T5CJI6_9FLAO|nr:NAD(P)/FAD-dependent oxidoreductase [Salegentibacter holothuriorum]SKB59320.1 putative flavoprotein involved in K+ transport [Salegentibacter holothuriorum]